MNPIDEAALKELRLPELVQRMDALITESIVERYGVCNESFRKGLVSDIVNSKQVSVLSEDKQRKIAYIAFSYIVQMELNSVASGFSNKILFTQEYDEKLSWQSPVFRLRDGAIAQYEIISSRIAMEIFMDLLHCIETGERLRSKRSKLKAFQKWLCDPVNQFHYFAHVLLEAYRFDRTQRTPEIHGTPKLPNKLLLLQPPTFQESNAPHQLINSLMGCWHPLRELLNGQRPLSMQISMVDEAWFSTYMTGSDAEIASKLAEMFEDIV
jgi:hypothetical protein